MRSKSILSFLSLIMHFTLCKNTSTYEHEKLKKIILYRLFLIAKNSMDLLAVVIRGLGTCLCLLYIFLFLVLAFTYSTVLLHLSTFDFPHNSEN